MTEAVHALTRDEAALLPGDDDVAFYRKHGWYITGKVFSDEEIDSFLEASRRYYDGERDRPLPAMPAKVAYWRPEDGNTARNNDYIHYESHAFRRLLTKPLVGAIAARLAETPEIRVFNTTLLFKPPEAEADPTAEGFGRTVVPWHFDRHYWQTCTSDSMLTAFIPLHDCDETTGTITMVDGSHAWREIDDGKDSTSRHFARRDVSELEEMLAENAAANGAEVAKVPMRLKKGHISFHHCRTYHGSGPNRSGAPRRAISLHLQDRDNAWRPFRLSDGSLLVYNNDELVRRDADGNPDYADPDVCPVVWPADAR